MAKYQILNHGVENSQYFQGCGVAYTEFDSISTGCGADAVEAYDDAINQMYETHDEKEVEKLNLPKHPRGYNITKRCKAPARSEETYVYVSIRYSL